MVLFDEILISIQKGDIITSKKGILAQSPITKEWYIYKKARYLENGKIEVLGEKQTVDVKIHKNEVTGRASSQD